MRFKPYPSKGKEGRDLEMAAEYAKGGVSLAELGRRHGITREAVRIAILRAGKPKPFVPSEEDAILAAQWTSRGFKDPRWVYNKHIYNAKIRGIPFLMTFREWMGVWGDRYAERKRGGLVMCRHGDAGPYAVGNVYIATQRENMEEWKRRFRKQVVDNVNQSV